MAKPTKIYLVDDDELMINVFRKKLEKEGFEVHDNFTGDGVPEWVESERPDLICLDLNFPGKFGLDILDELRTRWNTFELPVILITSDSRSEMLVQGLAKGANDYIQKPIHLEIAIARIRTQLEVTKLYRTSVEQKELEALSALIVTYNHEINNPMTIAMSALELLKTKNDPKYVDMAVRSMKRITEIVGKISALTKDERIQMTQYAGKMKMVELEKEAGNG